MNNSENTNKDVKWKLIEHVLPKLVFFFSGITVLEYIDQYGLSYSQFAGYDIGLKIIILSIPLLIFITFAFHALKLTNYFVISLIILSSIFLVLSFRPAIDTWRRCILDYIFFVVGSYLGGKLITEAWADFDSFRTKIAQTIKPRNIFNNSKN